MSACIAQSPFRRGFIVLCASCGAFRVKRFEDGTDTRVSRPEPISDQQVRAIGRMQCDGCGRRFQS